MDPVAMLTGAGGAAVVTLVLKLGFSLLREGTISLRSDKSKLWQRIDALESQIVGLSARIAALEGEKLELAKALAKKEGEYALLQRDYHDAGSMIRDLEQENGRLEQRLKDAHARIAEYETKAQAAKA
jgi:chromosome segregation ATPase